MSVLKDLWNGITPQKRREMDLEQERRKKFRNKLNNSEFAHSIADEIISYILSPDREYCFSQVALSNGVAIHIGHRGLSAHETRENRDGEMGGTLDIGYQTRGYVAIEYGYCVEEFGLFILKKIRAALDNDDYVVTFEVKSRYASSISFNDTSFTIRIRKIVKSTNKPLLDW